MRFLCIDIDALQEDNQATYQFHIGMSILDTRSVHTLVAGSPGTKQVTQAIESHHFIVGSPNFSRKSNKFLFGSFETTLLAYLKRELDTMTAHRDVVLVFHGDDREHWVLGRLDIDIHALHFVDTLKAAQHPFQLSYKYSLEKLLDELGIPFTNLHSAGNDAHFVLRALPIITDRDAERQCGASTLSSLTANLDDDCSSSTAATKAEIEAALATTEYNVPDPGSYGGCPVRSRATTSTRTSDGGDGIKECGPGKQKQNRRKFYEPKGMPSTPPYSLPESCHYS